MLQIFLLTITHLLDLSSSLICNYCYGADWKDDCHLNVKHCPLEEVCFIESSVVATRSKKQFTQYRMGCEHYSLCLDRVTYGERPYGYTVTNKTCCCHPLCEEPDGTGKGLHFHCPATWEGKEAAVTSGTSSLIGRSFKVLLCFVVFVIWTL